jgi:hypothetical protein
MHCLKPGLNKHTMITNRAISLQQHDTRQWGRLSVSGQAAVVYPTNIRGAFNSMIEGLRE